MPVKLQERWKSRGFTLKPLASDDPEENRIFVTSSDQIKKAALVFGILGLIGQAGLLKAFSVCCYGQCQCSPLSLVEECRGLALIGREDHSVAPPALLFHKEPAPIKGPFR